MRRATTEWQSALVDRIDLAHLSGARRGGKRKIRIAAGIGENLHLVVDAAEAPPRRVGERPVAMHEGIARRPRALPSRQAAELDQRIAELLEQPTRPRPSIRALHSMMEMDLDLAPTFAAVLRQAADDLLIELLRREEVRVSKPAAVGVEGIGDRPRVLATPLFEATLL